MERLTVSVEEDHLEKLVRQPLNGLAELIWNALDADASAVDVKLAYNALDGVDAVTVIDDGTGITPESAIQYFSQLGGSWKKHSTNTESGRRLHGRAGQGRWAAFGLGELVRWKTVADRVNGSRTRIEITGRRSSLRSFEVSDPEVVSDGVPTGTSVEVSNLTESAQHTLMREDIRENVTATFALYMQQYPVRLLWDGDPLDPTIMQDRIAESSLAVEGIEDVTLVIIEWKRPTKRALHLCDSSGTSLHELAPGVQAPGFEFTAYIKWDGFRDLQNELALAEMGHATLSEIIDAAKGELRRYFRDRAKDRGSELVKAWKDDKTYPYKEEPKTAVEQAERDLFEILAVTAAPVVEPADRKARGLSLRLLREAIEKSPSTVHEVLQDVLDLPQEQLMELRELTEKTSLSAIISAARQITDRLDFLTGLEQIVFDTELRQHVLERRQLHRILSTETWVFREEYALTADDEALRTALRRHIALLGRSELAPEEVEESEVLDEAGRRIVVDMMLSRMVEQRRNRREHVVIELKRPTVHIGMEQFSQIQTYATAVVEDGRFASVDVSWEFWIVGDELQPTVARMANQNNREPGIIVDGENFVVRAVTWAKVLEDARHRLRFVRDALNYSSANSEGMEYLQRMHSKFLPPITIEKAS